MDRVVKQRTWDVNEDIVVSGIAGRFAESNSIDELWEHLIQGTCLSNMDNVRWEYNGNALPLRAAKIKDTRKFDAEYFGFDETQAIETDFCRRHLLEVVDECIKDAGINPEELKGTKTGVYHGICCDTTDVGPILEGGNTPQKYATIVSEIFGLVGPICYIDTACASGVCAINEAFVQMKTGLCDRILIVSHNFNSNVQAVGLFANMRMVSHEGYCRCLDERAVGYGKGEAVVAILVEKKSQAKRIYATIENARSNTDGYKIEGITYPKFSTQQQLMEETCLEVGVDRRSIKYVEAHMTGTPVGDVSETEAISTAFLAEERDEPLIIGCLKSNINHTEGASGLCALVRSIKVLEHEMIPPIANFKYKNPNIDSLVKGYVTPALEATPFKENRIVCNGFGFGGANACYILRKDSKSTESSEHSTNCLPLLVTISGRTFDGLSYIFDFIKDNPDKCSNEFIALLHGSLSKAGPKKAKHKGFILLNDQKDEVTREIKEFNDTRVLMTIIFSDSIIKKCNFDDSLLKMDIIKKSLSKTEEILKNKFDVILGNNLMPGAIQIAIVDFFKTINLVPDKITGESSGQLNCAYFDDLLTQEEVVQSMYWIEKLLDKEKKLNDKEKSRTLKYKLDSIIKKTKKSSLWISDSSTFDEFSSDYLIDSLINPNQQNYSIPKNTLVVETRFDSNGENGSTIKLFNKHSDQLVSLLKSIGKLYNLGIECDIQKIYPEPKLPAQLGTPTISSLIKWDHSKDWWTALYPDFFNHLNGVKFNQIPLMNPGYKYLSHHCIDGKMLYPATALLLELINIYAGKKALYIPSILITDFKIERASMPNNGQFSYSINCNQDTGKCYIFNKEGLISSGTVSVVDSVKSSEFTEYSRIYWENVDKKENQTPKCVVLDSEAVYKELRIRGYDYGSKFQCVKDVHSDGTYGHVFWDEGSSDERDLETSHFVLNYERNFVTFVDSMLQMVIISKDIRTLFVPISVGTVMINQNELFSWLDKEEERLKKIPFNEEESEKTKSHLKYSQRIAVPVVYDPDLELVCAPGIYVRGIRVQHANRQTKQIPILSKYSFTTHDETDAIKMELKNLIRQYKSTIYGLLGRISKELIKGADVEKPAEDKIKHENIDLRFVLMDVLQNHINTTDKNVSNEVLLSRIKEEIRKNIKNDILCRDIFFDEKFSSSFIGLVADSLQKVNILEVNCSEIIFGNNYNSLISDGIIKGSHSLILPTELIVDEDDLPGLEVKRSSKIIAESNFKDKNLTIFMHMYSNPEHCYDIESFMNSAYNGSSIGSFLLVFCSEKGQESSLVTKLLENLKIDEVMIGFKDDYIKHLAMKSGFTFICKKSAGILPVCGLLFRKCVETNPEEQIVLNIDYDYNDWVEQLKTKLKEMEDEPETNRIWLKSAAPDQNGLLGFFSCILKEPNSSRIRCIYDYQEEDIDFTKEPWKQMLLMDLKINIRKNSDWGSMRRFDHTENTVKTKHAYIDVKTRGDLSSFKWFEAQHKFYSKYSKKANQLLIDVYYSALNFRDIMMASGRLPLQKFSGDFALQENDLGFEFAGKDENGNRVMGMSPTMTLATTVIVDDPEFIWSIPGNWSFEEAATIPCVYATVYYSLFMRGNLVRKESVLIHAGSGGVGLAALNVCLSMDCNIFTTVGSEEKKNYLMETFPNLKPDQIMNSRSDKFEEEILIKTNGRGVDLVLNSLSEEKQQSSIRCLAEYGRFLEIGKFEMFKDSELDLQSLQKSQTFHGILLDSFFKNDLFGGQESSSQIKLKREIKSLISDGIKSGVIKPLKRTIFSKDEVEKAFRFMATGKHIGKVLIKIRDEIDEKNNATELVVDAIPRSVFKPDKSYIIIGGLGGLGLEVAYWMAKRGAKNIILTSRSGPKNPYHFFSIERLQASGVNVVVSKCDISSYEEALELINEAKKYGPVGGIINSGLNLSDAAFENQTAEKFKAICDVKMNGTLHLDKISRELDLNLDYFVCFSSVVTRFGNFGQTNYCYANSAMERICEKRRDDGLHGLAIEWGTIGDVGYVVDTFGTESELAYLQLQRLTSVFQTYDTFLSSNEAVLSSCIIKMHDSNINLQGDLYKAIKNILGLKSDPDMNATLRELGMDSLMAVEIKQVLERDYDVNLSVQEIRELKMSQVKAFSDGTAKLDDRNKLEIKLSYEIKDLSGYVEDYVKLNAIEVGKPIFFFGSFDGLWLSLKPLTDTLNRPAIGLNMNKTTINYNDKEEYYDQLVKLINSLDNSKLHHLIGYESGAYLAMRVANKLSNNNPEDKQLVLLNGSTKYANHYFDHLKKTIGDDITTQYMNSLLFFMSTFSTFSENIRQHLDLIKENEDKLKAFNEILTANDIASEDTKIMTELFNIFHEKFTKNIEFYSPTTNQSNYPGDCLFINSSIQNLDDFDGNFDIQKDVSGDIKIINVENDLLNQSNLEMMLTELENYFG